ncbi:hypothetical protein [Thauera aromatica]|uniref:hypothetical protein n=1 Tax=Thauera aromatica TaxID=59405 RepID=UPI001FFCFAEA|nr:hypothetical protein [Thauera aromatica]MCK2097572.1 hypothetical protein [Thauera aromatica]
MGRYLDLLKRADQGGACTQGHQTTNHQNLQNPEKGGFDGFVGRSYGTRAHTHPAADETPTDTAQPVRASGWLFHFADREPLESWFSPAVDHDEALAAEPDALAAEPIPEHITRAANLIERDELLALVRAIYAGDTDQDRREAIDAALADPAGALTCYRAIAAERGIAVHGPVRTPVRSSVRTQTAVVGCSTCRHRKRPGRADPGYCGGGRDDLPGAYGLHHPLKKLP